MTTYHVTLAAEGWERELPTRAEARQRAQEVSRNYGRVQAEARDETGAVAGRQIYVAGQFEYSEGTF